MDPSLLFWIIGFLVESLFFAWVLFWGGAERAEGTFLAELIAYRGIMTSAGGLKLIAGVLWVGTAIWFVLGLFSPEVRFY